LRIQNSNGVNFVNFEILVYQAAKIYIIMNSCVKDTRTTWWYGDKRKSKALLKLNMSEIQNKESDPPSLLFIPDLITLVFSFARGQDASRAREVCRYLTSTLISFFFSILPVYSLIFKIMGRHTSTLCHTYYPTGLEGLQLACR